MTKLAYARSREQDKTGSPAAGRWGKKDLLKHNRNAAREAEILGTRIIRSCSGGLMRWNPENPQTEILLKETAHALKTQKQMLMDHNAILAIETHFEFTTFELLRVFEMCEAEPGEYLGICLDTMNLLVMLEDPVSATERILPWVVSTHIKDGAITLSDRGLKAFTVETGKGIVNLERIIALLSTLPHEVALSIEDHKMLFDFHVFDPHWLSLHPDLTREELARVIKIVWECQERIQSGELPDPAEYEKIPHGEELEERLLAGRDYLKGMIRRLGLDG